MDLTKVNDNIRTVTSYILNRDYTGDGYLKLPVNCFDLDQINKWNFDNSGKEVKVVRICSDDYSGLEVYPIFQDNNFKEFKDVVKADLYACKLLDIDMDNKVTIVTEKTMNIYDYAKRVNYVADYYDEHTGLLYGIKEYGEELKSGNDDAKIKIINNKGKFLGYARKSA
jgi:hypothetical protein